MTQVAKREPEPMPAPPSETVAFVQMIERAARDPNCDVDKMERLLAMQEKIIARNAEQAFAAAMSAAQAEMRPVAADANNPQTRSRYASYLAVDRALRPIYVKHGFALSFDTAPGAVQDVLTVLCDVMHTSGHTRRYSVPMPADGKGAKGGDVMTKTHATAAAITYGQRYLLKMIFSIAVGEDDDGNDRTGTVTEQQAERLQALVVEVGANIAKFLAWAGAESVSDIPAVKFDAAVKMLEAKRGAKR